MSGMGPVMENQGMKSGDGCGRRWDYEQQPARSSTLGTGDQVFPVPFLNLCEGSNRRGLWSEQRTRI